MSSLGDTIFLFFARLVDAASSAVCASSWKSRRVTHRGSNQDKCFAMYRDSPLQTGRLSLCSAADCAKHIEYKVKRITNQALSTLHGPNEQPTPGPTRGAADFPCLRQLPPPPELQRGHQRRRRDLGRRERSGRHMGAGDANAEYAHICMNADGARQRIRADNAHVRG